MNGKEPRVNGRKSTGYRKKDPEGVEFDAEITTRLDNFYREFNYSYPGKNKEELISSNP